MTRVELEIFSRFVNVFFGQLKILADWSRVIITGVRTAFQLAAGTLLASAVAFGQTGAPAKGNATVWVRPGYYKQLKPDRLKPTITQILKQDVDNPPSTEAVMFVGSSTIADWDVRHYFPQYRTVKRGISDSLISEMTRYADQLIVPFKPSTIVFYSGDNDAAYGMPADSIAADFSAFVKKIHEALPKTELVVLAIRPTVARESVWETERAVNDKINEMAEKDKQIRFVDIADLLAMPDSKPVREMLGPDLQHLNTDGYDLISSAARVPVKQAENQYWRGFSPPKGQ
jgi:lysophospholipase L1-like esterase